MSESDGVDEALGQSLREALRGAERFGQEWSKGLGRLRERIRQRQDEAERRAQAVARYQDLWERAQDRLAVVNDSQWWDKASPEQIAQVYEVAVSWREHEVEAARIDDRIHEEVLERYDHDLRTPTPEQLQDDLEKIEAQRQEEKQAEAGEEELEGEPSLVPEPGDRDVAVEEERSWDSEEHRTLVEQQLRDDNVEPDLIQTRLRVEQMNARAPQDAVQSHQASTRLNGPRGRPRARVRQRQPALG